MDIGNTLKDMGLSETESKVYIAALQLGQAFPATLAKKARVKRPTLYKLLPRLKELGLITETVVGKRTQLVAEDPHNYLERKQRELDDFESMVPHLRLLLITASIKPKIIFYEGVEGLKRLSMENLNEKK